MSKETLPPACAACLSRLPERLVVLGLRGWLSGYENGDIACWETVWNDYARVLGPERAKTVVAELAAWVRTLRREGTRDLDCYPRPCRLMCRDECMALGLVAGCQSEAWPAACAAAQALAGPDGAEAVLASCRSFAAALAEAGQCVDGEPAFALAGLASKPAQIPLH